MNDENTIGLRIAAASDMEQAGRRAASGVKGGQVVYLRGELGAGKTTWVRGLVRGLNYSGPIKSPTYTLLETYDLRGCNVYHFDLYRLRDPNELEDLAFRDYLDGSGICLVEWPERGLGCLPAPDCLIDIQYDNGGRYLTMKCATKQGESLCAGMR